MQLLLVVIKMTVEPMNNGFDCLYNEHGLFGLRSTMMNSTGLFRVKV